MVQIGSNCQTLTMLTGSYKKSCKRCWNKWYRLHDSLTSTSFMNFEESPGRYWYWSTSKNALFLLLNYYHIKLWRNTITMTTVLNILWIGILSLQNKTNSHTCSLSRPSQAVWFNIPNKTLLSFMDVSENQCLLPSSPVWK